MIPRKIHFIWLGGGNLDKQSLICINSAKRILPNYQIVIWTEKKLDLEKIANENRFLRECLKRKLWAFVSDYLRLYVLYHYGGIYLDTDVQIIKPFSKEMLSKSFFAGLEDRDFVGTGIIGAEKKSQIIQRLLEFYEKEIWKVNYFNNPIIFKHVLKQINKSEYNAKIYSQEYFSPYAPRKNNLFVKVTNNTTTIHWYNANWGMSRKGYVFLQTKHYNNFFIKELQILKKNVGYYRKKFFKGDTV